MFKTEEDTRGICRHCGDITDDDNVCRNNLCRRSRGDALNVRKQSKDTDIRLTAAEGSNGSDKLYTQVSIDLLAELQRKAQEAEDLHVANALLKAELEDALIRLDQIRQGTLTRCQLGLPEKPSLVEAEE